MPFLKRRLSNSILNGDWRAVKVVLSFQYLGKWLVLAVLVGIMAGCASALFLVLLEAVTNYREAHLWLLGFLPVGGFLIGYAYHRWGQVSEGGNNLLLQRIQSPFGLPLPWVMAPLVLLGTLLTHLVGGSAGREGTAVQMGGALADQLTIRFKLTPRDRRILLICGISAGFSSVFGTPLAGAVFALEVMRWRHQKFSGALPSLLAAFLADAVTTGWGVGHTIYPEVTAPEITLLTFGSTVLAGLCFGLAAQLFAHSSHAVAMVFKKIFAYAPWRPVAGGALLLVLVWFLGTSKYIGLGIPTILASFTAPLPWYDFLLKIALTALTLGAGFKGGEVTPLFFIGATLGNALFSWLPLPLEVLAALGFMAVFAGAAKTPWACLLMALEIFGLGIGFYAWVACLVAYFFSGRVGIYNGQAVPNQPDIPSASNQNSR